MSMRSPRDSDDIKILLDGKPNEAQIDSEARRVCLKPIQCITVDVSGYVVFRSSLQLLRLRSVSSRPILPCPTVPADDQTHRQLFIF